MNRKLHITDQELQRVVNEKKTLTDPIEIESHISSCDQCQTRLLAFAADPDWRAEFVGNLSDDFSCDFSGETLLRESTVGLHPSSKRQGDEFDLETVDSMLKEILEPPIHPEMLGRLGRYEIESVIGCGGMGVVLRGYDRDLQRPVAIKLVLPRLSKNGTSKQRFAREARAAAAILHPNVISIHGIDETKGVPWFVMPMILGPSLKGLLEEKGPLPEREIVRIGLQIASGLAAAHSQGLVHRDIKPENILIDNRVNRVVITDFGLARRDSEESMTKTGYLTGTLNYMSPEQARGQDVDARSDLFSLGSLLYFLASGVVPFRAGSPMGVINLVTNEAHPDVRGLNPEISLTLADVIDRLLEKDPEHRFQSAVELESFFEQYISHLHHPTKNVAPVVVRAKKAKASHSRLGAIVLALLGIAVATGVGWKMYSSNFRPAKHPAMLWAEIQETYQISDADNFETELSKFGRELNSLGSSLETVERMESTSTAEELSELNRHLDQLEKNFK